MNTEEKAKRYDEVLEMCKKLYNEAKANGYTFDMEDYESIFPELKESEDERIRTKLLNLLKELLELGGVAQDTWSMNDCEQFIAWLEKQCQDGKVWFYRDDYVRDKKQAYQDGIDKVLNNPQKYGLEKQGEQKPAWSEEDEKTYRRLHNLIYSTPYCDSRKELSDWLESLKDRVQPQPNQEWSEEDEEKRKIIMHRLSLDGTINNKDLANINDWLKSLRPQNTWKPSNEQMLAIDTAINVLGKGTLNGKQLIELQEQLKKFKRIKL